MNLGKRLRHPLLKLASLVRDFDPLDNYLIFSEPRGGSTWLAEIVHTIPRTAIVWEPVNARIQPELARMKVGLRQYVPQDAPWPELEHFLLDVLSGRRITYSTGSHMTTLRLLRAERLLVKFCRANALLPWFSRTFALVRRPVYLLRHPFAVVASQLHHGAWGEVAPKFELPEGPFSEYYQPHAAFLSTLNTIEETLTARWCLANKPALESSHADRWITVHYELLAMDPEREVARIFSEWQTPLPSDVVAAVRSPSRTVRHDDFHQDAEAQLSKWQKHLDPDARARMQDVLDYFQIRAYSGESTTPMGSMP